MHTKNIFYKYGAAVLYIKNGNGNGCMRFVDTKQLFQACNNNSIGQQEREVVTVSKDKKKCLFLQIIYVAELGLK